MGALSSVLTLVGDFINIIEKFKLLGVEPPVVVFEDYPPNPLPACLYTETFKAEAEPAFHHNWFEWAAGIGPLEESAYERAEHKIWKGIRVGGQGGEGSADDMGQPASEAAGPSYGERLAGQGFKLVRRKFYFDRHGYHAEVIMGRPLPLSKAENNAGCEINLDRGRTEVLRASRPFTCETLHKVLDEEANRITGVDTAERCWVSYSYEINPANQQVHFEWENFIRNPEEEEINGTIWDL
ncbi:MAG TPA: hypothetical protein DD490_16265 [Acidobacteria bacterium]|nr:hypothetical protein [Acidobacteriota bacterium]